jgi:hypothetical protein
MLGQWSEGVCNESEPKGILSVTAFVIKPLERLGRGLEDNIKMNRMEVL